MSTKTIVASGNTVVPAFLVLEGLGFNIMVRRDSQSQTIIATRDHEQYSADDPVTVLGLIKLVEARGWDWKANGAEIDSTVMKHKL